MSDQAVLLKEDATAAGQSFVFDFTPRTVARVDVPGEPLFAVEADGVLVALMNARDILNATVTTTTVEGWITSRNVTTIPRLEPLRAATEGLLSEVFGTSASLVVESDYDPESRSRAVVFHLHVPIALRGRRMAFIERYVRETQIPANSPVPVLLWSYVNDVSV